MTQKQKKPSKRQREADTSTAPAHHEKEAEPKTKRQFTEQDHKLSNVYERLADNAHNVRLTATKELLTELFPATTSPDAEAIEKAIRRLVRGLCSSRKAARYGFFVALTELLRQAYSAGQVEQLPPVYQLLDTVVELTKPAGQAAGQERRDHLIGRMYALKSAFESQVLFKQLQDWDHALEIILDLALQTPWLREECGAVLIDAIRGASSKANSDQFVSSCLNLLVKKHLWRTPEGVAIWITVQSSCPQFTAFPDDAWARNDPLAETNRKTLHKTMREQFNQSQDQDSKGDKNTSDVKGGFWQQSVHTSWEVVLNQAIALSSGLQPEESHKRKDVFAQLWQNLVDDGLFEPKASAERKFWGLQLFTKLIKIAPQAAISTMFSPNVISQLMMSLPKRNHMLNAGATEAVRKMKTRAKQEPDVVDTLVRGLLGSSGSLLFDRHTKSKTVEDLMGHASPTAFISLVKWLDDCIADQKDKEQEEADNERTMIADILLNGQRSYGKEQGAIADSKVIKRIINTLLKYAYGQVRTNATTKAPQPMISTKSRAVFHERLSSILGQLLSESADAPSKWPWWAIDKLHSMTKSSKDLELVLDADKDVKRTIKSAFAAAKDLAKQTDFKAANGSLMLLYSLTLLQAYSGEADAVELLNELNEFIDSRGDHGAAGSNYDQILEVLLTFVSKPSQLYRRLAGEVFPSISSNITADGLESLFAILRQPETLKGQSELFDQVEEVEDQASDSSDDSEIDSDVEMINGIDESKNNGEEEASDSDEEDEEEDDDNDDDEEPDQELTEFEAKLAEALKTSAVANGKAGDDNDDDDDASMNDEEMMAIEPQLAAVFRERRKKARKPKEQKRAKENVINFKRRILDLLKLYVKTQHASDLSLLVILPLLELLRSTKEKSLQNDAVEILKLHAATCQKNKLYPHANAETWTLLSAVHEEARAKVTDATGNAHLHAAACSRASLFAARVLLREDRSNYARVSDVYCASMKKWFERAKAGGGNAAGVQATFFTEFVSWSAEVRKIPG